MKKFLAATLVVLMLVSLVPASVFAANVDVASTSVDYGAGLTVVTDDKSTLAPGVDLNEVVALDKNGDRVEMYVTTVDTTVDTVDIYANYKDNQNSEYGLQTLSEQVAAMEANYEEPFKVVAGINASYYNTSTGKPTGAFVMEGIDVTTESEGNNYAFFAVLNDGTYMIGNKGEYSSYKGQIKEAIGGYVHIVKDGAVVSGLDKTTKYPRQTLGLTADGKVILMTADGSQVPKTIGLTYQEQAEVMLALGCVDAIHLDGGNSATFGGIREGTEEFVLINTPSGNVERAVSNTLCIVSTAVADGAFDHATISGEYDYFLPYSTYTFTAKGIDASGGPADEIPDDVEWALSDASYGTIADGTFVSNGKTGTFDIQMVQNGNVVGSITISVVNPESIAFDAAEKTIPYGKTSALNIEAIYKLNEVYVEADAFDFTIANTSAGTMSGFDFTATTAESVTGTTVTAEYKYADMDAISVVLKFGKGSEILYDFEDGNVDEWLGADVINTWIDAENEKILEEYPDAKYTILDTPSSSNGCGTKNSSTFLATNENGGKVKHGEGALAITLDRTYDKDVGSWSYNYLFYTGDTQVWRDIANGKNATKIGMWIYLPEEAAGLYARICRTFTKDSSGKLYTNYDYLSVNGTKFSQFVNIPEDGWVYAEFDLTAYNYQSSLQFNPYEDYAINNGKSANSNYYPGFLQFFVNTYDMDAEKVTIYIDDITLDYSDVTEDRNAPVISDAKVSENIDNFVALNGQTVTNNQVSFEATIAEVTNTNNYTGLNYSTAKIYIDGIDMSGSSSFKAAGTTIALSDVYLTNGKHEIVFEVADKQGNYTKLTKTLVVNGSAANAVVSIAGHNNGNETPKAGSVYYVDVVASDASKVKNITTTLKMQTANVYELEHIVTADGVAVTYDFDELNNEVTLNITNNGTATGETILASIPVRVWAWNEELTGVTASAQQNSTNSPIVNIIVESVYGEVKYADGVVDSNYVCGFYSTLNVATEVQDVNIASGGAVWHKHTAVAVDDLDPTCTEAGYEGRTYCEGCSSVVDWGTTLEATGHNFVVTNGSLVCDNCSAEDAKTGLFTDETGTYYLVNGVAQKGWQFVDNSWYYFDTTAVGYNGELEYFKGITYTFTDGKLDSGIWAKTLYGTRYYYGPDYYKKAFYTIDGEEYYFDGGYRLEGGWQLTLDMSNKLAWYYFDENGVCDKDAVIEDGFYTDRNGYAYAQDGVGLRGLQLIDGTYYYFDFDGYATTGTHAGLLFGEDYKAVTGILDTDDGLVYYQNGRPYMAGMLYIDGDYYFATGGGKIITNEVSYNWKSNGLLPEGDYEYGPDGKMLNGIVEKDGTLYYYENGKGVMAGMICIDGDYYFATGGGELIVNRVSYNWKSNGLLPEGDYEYGPDGKMLDGIVEKDGKLYYYEKGKAVMAGMVCIDGDYYFATGGGELIVNRVSYNWKSNGLLPERDYEYGPDGKMLDGIVEKDGKLYYYELGRGVMAGMICIDGDYYFATGGGELIVNRVSYNWKSNGLLPERDYEYGPDGKMLDGIVEKDGKLYYYELGRGVMAGMICIDGDYYFASGGGELIVDRVSFNWKSNDLLPVRDYEFGSDGKVLDGIVEKDGKLYYYELGRGVMAGLVEVDGDYYFAGGPNGEITVSEYKYVWKGNGILPEAEYYFGEDGKMLNGFLTIDGVLYHYENGKPGPVGLTYIDGYYYFIDYNGVVSVNTSQYVWKTNGYSIPMNYYFDELGRAVID